MIDYKFYEFLADFKVNERIRELQEQQPRLMALTLKASPLDLAKYFDPVPLVILGMRVIIDDSVIPGTILIEPY